MKCVRRLDLPDIVDDEQHPPRADGVAKGLGAVVGDPAACDRSPEARPARSSACAHRLMAPAGSAPGSKTRPEQPVAEMAADARLMHEGKGERRLSDARRSVDGNVPARLQRLDQADDSARRVRRNQMAAATGRRSRWAPPALCVHPRGVESSALMSSLIRARQLVDRVKPPDGDAAGVGVADVVEKGLQVRIAAAGGIFGRS